MRRLEFMLMRRRSNNSSGRGEGEDPGISSCQWGAYVKSIGEVQIEPAASEILCASIGRALGLRAPFFFPGGFDSVA
jgi:hypothetical protein